MKLQKCIVKITDLGRLRECGTDCEYLSWEQACKAGLMYSGWYHAGTPRPHLGHQAVPKNWI